MKEAKDKKAAMMDQWVNNEKAMRMLLAKREVVGWLRNTVPGYGWRCLCWWSWHGFTYLPLGPFINDMPYMPPDSGVVWEALIRL